MLGAVLPEMRQAVAALASDLTGLVAVRKQIAAERERLNAEVASLTAELMGELVTPDDPAYDDARKIWNGHIDRRPALIARCEGVADRRLPI